MKVLFLSTQDLESPAGVGRYFPLARELVRLGHQVTITALHANFASLKEFNFMKEGVEIRYVAQMHVLKQDDQKFYFPARKLLVLVAEATWALSRAALSIKADIVHIGKPHPMNSIAGLIARRLQGTILFLDYDDYEAGSGHFSGSWQRRVVAFFEDFIPRRVHCVTTHNSFLRERLLACGVEAERIVDLSNGVDFKRFETRNPGRLEKLRVELNLKDKKVIAFIGSLSSPSHPLDLLLEAFQQVQQSLPESVLLIVGGGEERQRLVDKATQMGLGEAVRFCGHIPSHEVPDYYYLANVTVDPVYDDPAGRGRLPLKLFESWAAQVPFVTGDVGERRAVLGSPPAGILARPGNPEALGNSLLQVLQNPELAKELVQRGRERAGQYSWARLARQLEAAYQEALSQKTHDKANPGWQA